MKLGVIARADARGLGIQTKAFHDNMSPAKTLVVCASESKRVSATPLPIRADWYPDARTCTGLPGVVDIEWLLDGIDAVYTAETGYGNYLWSAANQRGVKTVLHANYEFLDRNDQPTVWAAPSRWHIDDWPTNTVHLPVPIETHRIEVEPKPDTATRFLHVIGRPARHAMWGERNGTVDLLKALPMIASDVTVTVTCQVAGYVEQLLNEHHVRVPDHINLVVQTNDIPNYWELYRGHHAMILPRRFGGLCLPANEAVGAGMPVIMPDIDPNNRWLPKQWLTPAVRQGEARAKQPFVHYRTEPEDLADKIDQLAGDTRFYRQSVAAALDLRSFYSWTTLKPRYEQVFQ